MEGGRRVCFGIACWREEDFYKPALVADFFVVFLLGYKLQRGSDRRDERSVRLTRSHHFVVHHRNSIRRPKTSLYAIERPEE